MRWVECVACMGDKNAYKVLVGNVKGKDLLGDLGMDGRIILKLMLRK
jgi:hypothetical protein